jgi:hypothetical protein
MRNPGGNPCRITGTYVDNLIPGGPGDVMFAIESTSFSEVDPGEIPPEMVSPQFRRIDGGGLTLCTVTVEKLRELLYDAERAPGRTLALAVHPDGTIEAEPCAPTS